MDWNIVYRNTDIDAKINKVSNVLRDLFNLHAPFKSARFTKIPAPWLTDPVKLFIKIKDNALRKFRRTKNADDWLSYKTLRNYVNGAIKREKRAFLNFNLPRMLTVPAKSGKLFESTKLLVKCVMDQSRIRLRMLI